MFDHSWIEIQCPKCGFTNAMIFRQVRLQERIICTGCHRMIQLLDEHASSERGERQINKTIERLTSQLKDIKITIKL